MFKLMPYILDTDLQPVETLLLITIVDFADENGVSQVSLKLLSQRSRVAVRKVKKYLSSLADGGWLDILSAGREVLVLQLEISRFIPEKEVVK